MIRFKESIQAHRVMIIKKMSSVTLELLRIQIEIIITNKTGNHLKIMKILMMINQMKKMCHRIILRCLLYISMHPARYKIKKMMWI